MTKALAVVVVLVLLLGAGGYTLITERNAAQAIASGDEECTSCDSPGASKTAAENGSEHAGRGIDANGRAAGSTLLAAYMADALFTCPMHPEVITDRADARCPLCGMELAPLSAEETAALKASEPKGCPMHPVVVPGDSETDTCPICGMDLVTVAEAHGRAGVTAAMDSK
ncbi:MAG: hypothetical protein MAG453_00183 [Calditrichaeota bacterium]|nr:hypothetical protein [Calditrichota bacterium]